MGLQQVSTHHAVVPRNKQNIDQTLSERSEILAPYLAAIAKAKESNQSDSSERQLLDVLFRLVEMTELSKLKAAEMVADWYRTRRDVVLAEMEALP